jgi:ABC-type bacteriocin/lantibiotic exporter with double-glycine peptidase domain
VLLHLHQAAAALGFRSRAVHLGLERLAEVGLPAIAHLAPGHYVVLYALASGAVVLGDPARGVYPTSIQAFAKAWTGCLLLLEPSVTPAPGIGLVAGPG